MLAGRNGYEFRDCGRNSILFGRCKPKFEKKKPAAETIYTSEYVKKAYSLQQQTST
jgi:hypothetical protein